MKLRQDPVTKQRERYECGLCGAVFGKRSAYGGHKSHCMVIVPKEKEPEPCTCFTGSGHCDQHEADAW